jgi:NAD(P)H-hydrate epimerase
MAVLNREQTRLVDRRAIDEFGLPGLVLMENAGRGTAETILRLDLPGPFSIACGKGNNGGDGFVVARHLDLARPDVRVLLWCDPAELRGDALVNFRAIDKAGLPIEVFGSQPDLARLRAILAQGGTVVDALLGTGAAGEPRPPLDTVIDELNASGLPIVAVDLPSGLDCDTGQASAHTIKAAHTCTFVALKPGFLVPGAHLYTGQVHVLSIGAPRRLVAEIAAGK